MTNLYFANLPSYLSETDLKLMIAPFGQVGRHGSGTLGILLFIAGIGR